MSIYSSLLTNKCARYCNTPTVNDLGENEPSWALHTDNIKCRFSPVSLEEAKELSGINIYATYKCYILPDQDISTHDRIEWNSDFYEIVEVKIDSESMTKRLFLKRL